MQPIELSTWEKLLAEKREVQKWKKRNKAEKGQSSQQTQIQIWNGSEWQIYDCEQKLMIFEEAQPE